MFFVECTVHHRVLHSFPTHALPISDLTQVLKGTLVPRLAFNGESLSMLVAVIGTTLSAYLYTWQSNQEDRKSTRLNSSHVEISYAVFCLKKKKRRRVDTAAIALVDL